MITYKKGDVASIGLGGGYRFGIILDNFYNKTMDGSKPYDKDIYYTQVLVGSNKFICILTKSNLFFKSIQHERKSWEYFKKEYKVVSVMPEHD